MDSSNGQDGEGTSGQQPNADTVHYPKVVLVTGACRFLGGYLDGLGAADAATAVLQPESGSCCVRLCAADAADVDTSQAEADSIGEAEAADQDADTDEARRD